MFCTSLIGSFFLLGPVTPEYRADSIRRARVWFPIQTETLNLLQGPPSASDGRSAFAFNEEVHCTYVQEKLGGTSPKFRCKTSSDENLKVRYGQGNTEVFGTVAASRLFWALGFPTAKQYPVRVICDQCPKNPWKNPRGSPGLRAFEFATIEQKLDVTKLEEPGHDQQGWGWQELGLVSEAAGGASRAEIDALKLLSAFAVHVDSDRRNQRLACPNSAVLADGRCAGPIMYVHDLGTTFGGSPEERDYPNAFHKRWRATPLWRAPSQCVAELDPEGHDPDKLVHPKISEAGRAFLADLLKRLSDRQIHDLFTAARVEYLEEDRRGEVVPVSAWVETFKKKRREITDHRCPG